MQTVDKKLELKFIDSRGKNLNLSVDNPKESLEEEEVREAMETIIGENVFSSEGELREIGEARFITRTVSKLI